MNKARIYVVEDDVSIREIVVYALRSAGFEAAGFETGTEFFAAALKTPPNLVLLDIMLPDEDGLSILNKLRSAPQTKSLPIIMLTAKSSEADKVKGLDMGADDYISKPFGVVELISRVKALLRRALPESAADSQLSFGCLSINSDSRKVCVDSEFIELTYKEYELLYYLTSNAGRALNRDKIMKAVWDYDFEGESRTLDMHIRSLRQKLGAAGEYIKTVRNVGYKLDR
jgi:two-component system alkaline phosphatase synthesis response regulator PhoP